MCLSVFWLSYIVGERHSCGYINPVGTEAAVGMVAARCRTNTYDCRYVQSEHRMRNNRPDLIDAVISEINVL